jgi:hypothetical protein
MLFAKGVKAGAVAALVVTSAVVNAGTFPDYGYQPPATYKGPLFQLSQNYPATLPSGPVPAFFKLLPAKLTNNFEQWRPYVEAVKQYCLEGNVENDWYVQKNTIRHWYHAPWQHYGPLGREGIHGLTKEAQIQSRQLAPTQIATGQTFAVGIYNDVGGYTIGQVWKNPQDPDPTVTSKPNSFHDGTVVCKALFADIDLKQVPFLVNPVWGKPMSPTVLTRPTARSRTSPLSRWISPYVTAAYRARAGSSAPSNTTARSPANRAGTTSCRWV